MAKFISLPIVTIVLIISFSSFSQTKAAYNVVSYGARGDGKTDSSQPFLRAWAAACSAHGQAEIYVPRGTYVIKSVSFNGPCKSRIHFHIDGTLVTPSNMYSFGSSGFWILFYKVSRLSVLGGTIDARGSNFWNCRRKGYNCPTGARSMTFIWCNNVNINGLRSYNSQTIHVAIDYSSSVKLSNLFIRAPSGSPNTDGIHIQNSKGVTVTGSTIRTGDDCVSIGPGSMNVWISKVGCGPGHGISVGSLGNSFNEEGVQNVTVVDTVFTKTQNGVRVKSWPRPSGGYARNLKFSNLIMKNVGNPIIIDQRYCPNNNCPHQSSGVKVNDIKYENIKGTTTTQAAIKLDCSSSNPCRGISLQDIKLTHVNRYRTFAYCNNASGAQRGTVIPKSCL